jgi:hypothetical protein
VTPREAKELLARRYRHRGFPVRSIRTQENSYLVIFGEDEKGKGLGPGGLSSMRCNPPTGDPGAQLELPVKKRKRRR